LCYLFPAGRKLATYIRNLNCTELGNKVQEVATRDWRVLPPEIWFNEWLEWTVEVLVKTPKSQSDDARIYAGIKACSEQ
jgi:hypothetical protein